MMQCLAGEMDGVNGEVDDWMIVLFLSDWVSG